MSDLRRELPSRWQKAMTYVLRKHEGHSWKVGPREGAFSRWYQCLAATAKQDVEVLTVPGLAEIGALTRSRFDQLVDAAAQLLQHGILIKAVIGPSQDEGQTIDNGRLGSRLQNNGTDFHITAFKT